MLLKEVKLNIFCYIITLSMIVFADNFNLNKLSLKFKNFLKSSKSSRLLELEKEIINLKSSLISLKEENNNLKKYELIHHNVSKYNHVKTIVEIMHIHNSIDDKYIITETNDSVENNDLAVDQNGILIGRVVWRDKKKAKIQLLSSQYSNIPVYSNNSNGIAFGTNSINCKIGFQNLSNTIPTDGDIVITSGEQGLTIKGIIVGVIKHTSSGICIENDNINFIDKVAIIGK